MTRGFIIVAAFVGSLAGCGQPARLQYDFSRCYTETMQTQADLGRPTVAASAYPLSGFEGIELRQRVTEESTDTESGEVDATATFDVQ